MSTIKLAVIGAVIGIGAVFAVRTANLLGSANKDHPSHLF